MLSFELSLGLLLLNKARNSSALPLADVIIDPFTILMWPCQWWREEVPRLHRRDHLHRQLFRSPMYGGVGLDRRVLGWS